MLLTSSESVYLEAQALPGTSTQDQVLDLAVIIAKLEVLWLNEPDIQQEIDAGDWQYFMQALYDSLVELHTQQVQIQ